jgi:hypothetical protein
MLPHIHQHCNWNIKHLDDPPYSAVIVDKDCDGVTNDGIEIMEECECKVFLVSGPTGTGTYAYVQICIPINLLMYSVCLVLHIYTYIRVNTRFTL